MNTLVILCLVFSIGCGGSGGGDDVAQISIEP